MPVGEVFTCMDFEPALPGAAPPPPGAARLLVGTLSGAVYTVDAQSRAVVGVRQVSGVAVCACVVFGGWGPASWHLWAKRAMQEMALTRALPCPPSGAQAHEGAVNAVAAACGFCLTGGADRLVRLWGGEEEGPCLEAEHEGAVTGREQRQGCRQRVPGCTPRLRLRLQLCVGCGDGLPPPPTRPLPRPPPCPPLARREQPWSCVLWVRARPWAPHAAPWRC